jgi:hypothetical protein
MTRYLVLILAVALSPTTRAWSAVLVGPVVYPGNGHSYYLTSQHRWAIAEVEAMSLGGHLVTLSDAAEHAWVFETFGMYAGPSTSLWTGFNDAQAEGTFSWISGEPVAYADWLPGQPDNLQGSEDYVHLLPYSDPFSQLYGPGHFNDNNGSFPFYGIAEVVPEPTAVGLILSGAAFRFFVGRRRPRFV